MMIFLSPSCIPFSPEIAYHTSNGRLAQHFWRSDANEATDLIGDGDVSVLAEGVAFGETGGRVFDQVEGAQLSERHEQLFDLQFNETICVLS
jgi:hypothetical protein